MDKLIYKGNLRDFKTFAEAGITKGSYNERAIKYFQYLGATANDFNTAYKQALAIGGGFTPLQLFANGEQGAWYDPSDLSTLYRDAAGTTPVTADGDPVGLMLDKSGNGNHASQALSVSRPRYRTDGTLHWLEFDGVYDFLRSSNVDFSTISAVSLFAAIKKNSDSSTGTILNHKNNQYNAFTLLAPGGSPPSDTGYQISAAGNAALQKTDFSEPAPDKSVISASVDLLAPAIIIRRNSVHRGSNSNSFGGGTFTDSPLYIGTTLTTGAGTIRFFKGDIYGIVVVENDVDMLSTENYLAQKSGVQL